MTTDIQVPPVKKDIDASALATKMLEWEKLKYQLDYLEDLIKQEVKALGKTITVGNVRATYSQGRKVYDYQGAAIRASAPESIVNEWKKTTVTVDWRGVCGEMGIDEIPFVQSDPSVSLKLEV